jgi:hypothetical protein
MKTLRLLALLLLPMAAQAASKEDLYGTWRLLSFIEQNPTTGEKIRDAYGPNPRGFLTYGQDGRMWAMIVTADRPKRSEVNAISDEDRIELFKTVIAYSGTYTFDGKKATHHVDISWNETWTSTAQIRNLKLEGNRVVITTDPLRSVVDPQGQLGVFVLVWERVQ